MAVSSPLIDVAGLARALREPDPPVLLDIRWSLVAGAEHELYLRGHLPEARFVSLDADLADPPGPGGRHPLPSAQRFTEAMRRAGVSEVDGVVCYDAGPGMSAARAWWLIRYFGHLDVRVLDGGYAAWLAAGLAVQTGDVLPAPGGFTPRQTRVATLDADEIGDFVASGHLLLDARATERYLGLTEPVDPVAGHIPGAVSAPTSGNVRPDGTFGDPAALRTRFGQLGVSESRPTAVYCGSGVTAAHEVLALELAGFSAALYPGSWSHWITDPARPVATS
jgi:thiosulfate/3-mercaptopyruvate sulfurtransferase